MLAIYGAKKDTRLVLLREEMRAADIPCALIGPEFGYASLVERLPFVCFADSEVPFLAGFVQKLPREKILAFPAGGDYRALVDGLKFAYYRRFGEDIENAAHGQFRFDGRRFLFRENLLPVTASERLILRLLFHSRGAYFSAEEIAACCLSREPCGVSVHICNINKKARDRLGVPLIETRRYYGYRIV